MNHAMNGFWIARCLEQGVYITGRLRNPRGRKHASFADEHASQARMIVRKKLDQFETG
jgi:hypothetical protein